jgi:hypothetical protein
LALFFLREQIALSSLCSIFLWKKLSFVQALFCGDQLAL